jgi:1-aminocyclopropane-1-carboxylate deaminase/D-cysteine desulfhydrase
MSLGISSSSQWNLASRVHQLHHFPTAGVACYVKREDELSCGISGSKLRKYSSLMPYLQDKGIRHLIIIAGPQSNNLLAALQMAREFQLKVTAFLLKPWTSEIIGNYKLSRLFLDEDEIRWVERKQWPQVELLAQDYASSFDEPGFVLAEGASVLQALLGAESLADDIMRNEHQLGFSFNHIFIDAGTGFSAAALIKGLNQYKHPATVHVLLLADDEPDFRHKLMQWLGASPNNYRCFFPQTAKAFGSVNQSVKNEIKRMAKEEGILVDPIYSAKLFQEARRHIGSASLKGKVLIIHSGGALTLAGFEF